MRGQQFCFWHHPDHAQEAAEARRLGGLRRRREKTIEGAYEFKGLGSVEGISRILEIAVYDTLGLENSIARSRALAYLAQTALRALEVGELEERLALLQASIDSNPEPAGSVFDRPAYVPDYEMIGDN
jgi:hypothetical protein